MANKKPAKKAATKKIVKKAVKNETVASEKGTEKGTAKAPPAQAAKKKTPAMKSAIRVTKKEVAAVKPASKLDLAQTALPFDAPHSQVVAEPPPAPTHPETACLANVPEPAIAAASPPQYAKPISHDDIRQRAYLKWEAAGRPHGDGSHFWAEAERELLQQT